MPNYAPRVSLSYVDMSGVVQEWSETCEKMVVYQHDPDSGCKRTHLHILMINSKYKTAEPLKRKFHSRVQTVLDANDLWSWVHKDYPNPDEKYIIYMTKGNLRPVFVKNFSPAELEELRSQWKEPTPKGESLTEKKESTKTKRELLDEMIAKYEELKNPEYVVLERIAEEITDAVLSVLIKNRIVFNRRKVQEYRDSVMGSKYPKKFITFANEDMYRFAKFYSYF